MRDPKQRFIVNTVTREQIAESLNNYLEDPKSPNRLANNDDRLTNELCQEYANRLGDLDELDADFEDMLAEIEYSLCCRLGLVETKDD